MKKLLIMLVAIVAMSACGRDDSSTCTCTNSDFVVVGTYTGLTEGECAEKENPTAGEYCTFVE